jgi:hypothetical protein
MLFMLLNINTKMPVHKSVLIEWLKYDRNMKYDRKDTEVVCSKFKTRQIERQTINYFNAFETQN